MDFIRFSCNFIFNMKAVFVSLRFFLLGIVIISISSCAAIFNSPYHTMHVYSDSKVHIDSISLGRQANEVTKNNVTHYTYFIPRSRETVKLWVSDTGNSNNVLSIYPGISAVVLLDVFSPYWLGFIPDIITVKSREYRPSIIRKDNYGYKIEKGILHYKNQRTWALGGTFIGFQNQSHKNNAKTNQYSYSGFMSGFQVGTHRYDAKNNYTEWQFRYMYDGSFFSNYNTSSMYALAYRYNTNLYPFELGAGVNMSYTIESISTYKQSSTGISYYGYDSSYKSTNLWLGGDISARLHLSTDFCMELLYNNSFLWVSNNNYIVPNGGFYFNFYYEFGK